MKRRDILKSFALLPFAGLINSNVHNPTLVSKVVLEGIFVCKKPKYSLHFEDGCLYDDNIEPEFFLPQQISSYNMYGFQMDYTKHCSKQNSIKRFSWADCNQQHWIYNDHKNGSGTLQPLYLHVYGEKKSKWNLERTTWENVDGEVYVTNYFKEIA